MFALGKEVLFEQVSIYDVIVKVVLEGVWKGSLNWKKNISLSHGSGMGAHLQHISCTHPTSQILVKPRANDQQGWAYLKMVPARVEAGTGKVEETRKQARWLWEKTWVLQWGAW